MLIVSKTIFYDVLIFKTDKRTSELNTFKMSSLSKIELFFFI